MKKSIIGIFSATMLIAAVTSCGKEEQEPREAGSATVKGMVEANINLTNDTLANGDPSIMMENVPSGTKLTFIINGADLDPNPDPTFNYKNELHSTTVESNGSFSISLPAYETPITATVEFDDFEANEITLGTDPDTGEPITVSDRRIYSRGNATVTIYDGAVVINDYNY